MTAHARKPAQAPDQNATKSQNQPSSISRSSRAFPEGSHSSDAPAVTFYEFRRREAARGSRVGVFKSLGAAAGQHNRDRAQEELQVEQQGPLLDVTQIHAHHLVEGHAAASLDLPDACNPRPYLEDATQMPRLVMRSLVGKGRAGTDEAHVALQDVEELGQLVDARCADEAADARD